MQHFLTLLAPRNLNRTTLKLFFSLNQRLSIRPFGRRGYCQFLYVSLYPANILCPKNVVCCLKLLHMIKSTPVFNHWSKLYQPWSDCSAFHQGFHSLKMYLFWGFHYNCKLTEFQSQAFFSQQSRNQYGFCLDGPKSQLIWIYTIFKTGYILNGKDSNVVKLNFLCLKHNYDMGLVATKPVSGGLRTTQAQTSLRICAVWSAP